MKAFQLARIGEAPAFAEITLAPPGPGELRIAVAACGLNFADLLMIEGRYQEKPALPVTLGMELSGRVTAIGAGVTGFAPGDRVAAYSGQDGLAPEANVAADRCIAVETGVVMVIYLNDPMNKLVKLRGNSSETISLEELKEFVIAGGNAPRQVKANGAGTQFRRGG